MRCSGCSPLGENHSEMGVLNQLNSVSSWFIDTKDTLLKPELQNNIVSWAAYNSSQHEEHPQPVTSAYLLPLFPEAAHSFTLIFHAMNVVNAIVAHLNPGQVPVLVADQPLFLIAKKIQWNYPQIFGEEQFVVFLGGMHVEMTAFRLLGNGWDAICSRERSSTPVRFIEQALYR